MRERWLKTLFLFLLIIATHSLEASGDLAANNNEFIEVEGKIYFPPASVYIAADAIYLNMHGSLVPVTRISLDEYGLYAEGVMAGRVTLCLRCNRTWTQGIDSPICPHKK